MAAKPLSEMEYAFGLLCESFLKHGMENVRIQNGEVQFGIKCNDEVLFERGPKFVGNMQIPSYIFGLKVTVMCYSLDAIVFFLHNDHRRSEYQALARQAGLEVVLEEDREDIIKLVSGQLELAKGIPDETIERIRLTRLRRMAELENQEWEPQMGSKPEKTALESVPLRDRESVLLAPTGSFANVLKLVNDLDAKRRKRREEREAAKAEKRARTLPTDTKERATRKDKFHKHPPDHGRTFVPTAAVVTAGSAGSGSRAGAGVPIIVVPKASQTLLSLRNARAFLEDGAFVDPEEYGAAVPGVNRDTTLQVRRGKVHATGEPYQVMYEVTDQPEQLHREDWDRVAAIVALGKEWQFKGWPVKDPVVIFNRYCGVYFQEDDHGARMRDGVFHRWNVEKIRVSRTIQHKNKEAALAFWHCVDTFKRVA